MHSNSPFATYLPFADLLCFGVRFVYPLLETTRVMKTTDYADTLWLCYWMIYGVFVTILDGVCEQVVPLYSEACLFLFLWLVHPGARGLARVESEVVRVFLALKREPFLRWLLAADRDHWSLSYGKAVKAGKAE